MGLKRGLRTRPTGCSIVTRIVLFLNLMAVVVYGAITPSQMWKVTAEVVAVAVAGLSMAVQTYVAFALAPCIPYTLVAEIVLDAICVPGWIASIIMLSYWDLNVVYRPQEGDPQRWFECSGASGVQNVWTDRGPGFWINLIWCQVEVGGQDRLVGNAAARQQLHVLIGLCTVSLLFTGILLSTRCHRYKRGDMDLV